MSLSDVATDAASVVAEELWEKNSDANSSEAAADICSDEEPAEFDPNDWPQDQCDWTNAVSPLDQ